MNALHDTLLKSKTTVTLEIMEFINMVFCNNTKPGLGFIRFTCPSCQVSDNLKNKEYFYFINIRSMKLQNCSLDYYKLLLPRCCYVIQQLQCQCTWSHMYSNLPKQFTEFVIF